MGLWRKSNAFTFAVVVCAFYWVFSIGGSFGPQIQLALPGLHFSIGSKFVLLMVASLIPATFCVIYFPESRSCLARLSAKWTVYFTALAVGFLLPFSSYLGSHYSGFPWGTVTEITLVRVFALNLCLSPLWEEIIWRGCFLKRMRSFSSAPGAILLSSLGWTVWHGGFIGYLYSEGISKEVLFILPLIYFFSGIILGSVFEMGRGSLWPAVVLHSGFNASTLVYYQSFNRASELSSYVAELIFMAIAAGILIRVATRSSAPSLCRETRD